MKLQVKYQDQRFRGYLSNELFVKLGPSVSQSPAVSELFSTENLFIAADWKKNKVFDLGAKKDVSDFLEELRMDYEFIGVDTSGLCLLMLPNSQERYLDNITGGNLDISAIIKNKIVILIEGKV